MTSTYIIMSKTLHGDTDDLMLAANGKGGGDVTRGFEKSVEGSRNRAQTPSCNCQMADITNICQDFKGENRLISRRPSQLAQYISLSPIREEVISSQDSSLLSEDYSDSDSEYHDNVSPIFERETTRLKESPNATWPHSMNGHLASKGNIPKSGVQIGDQSQTVVKNTQIPYFSVSQLPPRSLKGSSKICDSCGLERKDLNQADMNSNSTTGPYSLVPTQGLTLPLKGDSKDTSHYMVVPLFKGKEKLTRRQTIGLWLMKGLGFVIVLAILIWLFSSVIL